MLYNSETFSLHCCGRLSFSYTFIYHCHLKVINVIIKTMMQIISRKCDCTGAINSKNESNFSQTLPLLMGMVVYLFFCEKGALSSYLLFN